jgi:hypothetical protein
VLKHTHKQAQADEDIMEVGFGQPGAPVNSSGTPICVVCVRVRVRMRVRVRVRACVGIEVCAFSCVHAWGRRRRKKV